MQLPNALSPVIWNPCAAHCDYVFGNDGGMRKALDSVGTLFKSLNWDAYNPAFVDQQAARRGSDWVEGLIGDLKKSEADMARLLKELARTAALSTAVGNKIGPQITRHSSKLAATVAALDAVGEECKSLRGELEGRQQRARKMLPDILEKQKADEIANGKGPAFDKAGPLDLGLDAKNETILLGKKVTLYKGKYLLCEPITLDVRVGFLSEARHKGHLVAMKPIATNAADALVKNINEGIKHFDDMLGRRIAKGEITDKRDIDEMVITANKLVKQAVLSFERDLPTKLQAEFEKNKKLSGKLKQRKRLAVAKAVGGAVLATAAAVIAIAASGVGIGAAIAGAGGSFGAATPIAVASVVVGAVGIVTTAGGALGAWYSAYKQAKRDENRAEQELLSAYSKMKTHADKKAKARGRATKAANAVTGWWENYPAKVQTSKEKHWWHCVHMMGQIGKLEETLTNLRKGKADAEKKLADSIKKLADAREKQAKATPADRAVTKAFAKAEANVKSVEKLLRTIDGSIASLEGSQKAVSDRLTRKVEFHELLKAEIQKANSGKDVTFSKLETSYGKLSKAADDLQPIAKQVKNIAKAVSSLKKATDNAGLSLSDLGKLLKVA